MECFCLLPEGFFLGRPPGMPLRQCLEFTLAARDLKKSLSLAGTWYAQGSPREGAPDPGCTHWEWGPQQGEFLGEE